MSDYFPPLAPRANAAPPMQFNLPAPATGSVSFGPTNAFPSAPGAFPATSGGLSTAPFGVSSSGFPSASTGLPASSSGFPVASAGFPASSFGGVSSAFPSGPGPSLQVGVGQPTGAPGGPSTFAGVNTFPARANPVPVFNANPQGLGSTSVLGVAGSSVAHVEPEIEALCRSPWTLETKANAILPEAQQRTAFEKLRNRLEQPDRRRIAESVSQDCAELKRVTARKSAELKQVQIQFQASRAETRSYEHQCHSLNQDLATILSVLAVAKPDTNTLYAIHDPSRSHAGSIRQPYAASAFLPEAGAKYKEFLEQQVSEFQVRLHALENSAAEISRMLASDHSASHGSQVEQISSALHVFRQQVFTFANSYASTHQRIEDLSRSFGTRCEQQGIMNPLDHALRQKRDRPSGDHWIPQEAPAPQPQPLPMQPQPPSMLQFPQSMQMVQPAMQTTFPSTSQPQTNYSVATSQPFGSAQSGPSVPGPFAPPTQGAPFGAPQFGTPQFGGTATVGTAPAGGAFNAFQRR